MFYNGIPTLDNKKGTTIDTLDSLDECQIPCAKLSRKKPNSKETITNCMILFIWPSGKAKLYGHKSDW